MKACILCKGEHALYACNDLKRLSPPLRVQKVREPYLCFSCVGSNYQNIKCTFGPCRKCARKHNFTARASPNQVSYVLLATVRIYVYDKSGNEHQCRVLLDQGLQPHIMTNKLCKKLDLQRTRIGTTLSEIE